MPANRTRDRCIVKQEHLPLHHRRRQLMQVLALAILHLTTLFQTDSQTSDRNYNNVDD